MPASKAAEGRAAVLNAQREHMQNTLAALSASANRSPASPRAAASDLSYRADDTGAAQEQQRSAMQQQSELVRQALSALAESDAVMGAAVGGQQMQMTEGLFGELDELRAAVREVREESEAAAATAVGREVVLALAQELHAFKESTNQELAQLRTENSELRTRLGTADERRQAQERHNETLLSHAIAEATITIQRDIAEVSRRIGDVDTQERKMEERLVGVMADAKSGREILGSELDSLRTECERLRVQLAQAEERADGNQRAAHKLQLDVESFKKYTNSELPKLSTAIDHKAEADIVDVLEVQMKDVRSTIADLATKMAGMSARPSPAPRSSPRDLEAEIQRRSQAILSDFGSRGWDSFSPSGRERSSSSPPSSEEAAAAVAHKMAAKAHHHAAEEGIPEVAEDDEEVDAAAGAGAAGGSPHQRLKLSPRTGELAASISKSLEDRLEEAGGVAKEVFRGGSTGTDDDPYAGVRAD